MEAFEELGNKVRISDYGFTILQIETLLACNMNCKFCAYHVIKNKGIELATEDVHEAIEAVDPHDEKLEYICFNQYNEPLLDKRIFHFIKYAQEKGFKVLIITNALLFNSENMRERLISSAPEYLKISMQTISEGVFLESRGIKYSFTEYKRNLFEYLSSSLRRKSPTRIVVDIACNFTTKRKKAIKKILGLEYGDPSVPDSLGELSADLLSFVRELHEYDDGFSYDESAVKKYLMELGGNYELGLPLANNISIKVKPFIYGRRLSKFYPAAVGTPCGTRILSVLASGIVVPCCLAYDKLLEMGNIKKESLGRILKRNKMLIDNIKYNNKLPQICLICQGTPTKRGAILKRVVPRIKKLFGK